MLSLRGLVAVVALVLAFSACVEAEPTGTALDATEGPAPVVDSADGVTWLPIDEAESTGRRTALPLQMYYFERYLADVPDKTAADLALAEILDSSPETLEFFAGALENYHAMPESVKQERFDPEILQMLASPEDTFQPSDFLEVIDVFSVVQGLTTGPPLGPSHLVANNRSRPPTMEQDQSGAGAYGPDPVYAVTLSWRDNAFNEDGYHIYRWPYLTLTGVSPNLHATVGPDQTSFDDPLPEPTTVDDKICYQVTAYRDTPTYTESVPTESVCVEYHWSKVDLGLDLGNDDGDFFLNLDDECPTLPWDGGPTTNGCPDPDLDGWPNDNRDLCPDEWGEPWVPGEAIYKALPGCPQRFGINWMGLEATNNSIAYTHNIDNITTPDGKYAFLTMNEVDEGEGEEPYLLFEWVNGWNPDNQLTGSAEWCCGEGIDVAAGDVREPDGATPIEGNMALDRAIRQHGLEVFPVGDISTSPGLMLTTILMEMDWKALIRPESADTALDLLEAAATTAIEVGGCIVSAGIGCLIDLGMAIVDGFLEIFGSRPELIEVDDPDDVMGDAVWTITHQEALWLTGEDGAYGFWFKVPNPNYVACIPPVVPCTADIAIPSRLEVRVEMCLYREGIPATELRKLCEPYEWAPPWLRPWPPPE